jgi:hypothetical protein
MPNATSPPNPPDPFDVINGKLDKLNTNVVELQTAIGQLQTAIGNQQKQSRLGFAIQYVLVPIVVGLIAAAAAVSVAQKNLEGALSVAQKNLEATLTVAQNNLDKAAKSAFENAKGASALQDYRNGQELIAKIEDEFDESAVGRGVKKGLIPDLHAFKLLADRLKLPALTEFSDHAGQLLGDYWSKTKRWEDYDQQERQNMQEHGNEASKALDKWAGTSQ